ncbi:MerR family transcriptional regulator [Streptomyces sp. NPDC008222]|uniref:MerR family transcriptional regulator n=1 Tax=Streptomyces sp. NPDC008222 TaxID=3364820 RepID=UPI0036E5968F
MRISELSRHTSASQRSLRHYEEQGLRSCCPRDSAPPPSQRSFPAPSTTPSSCPGNARNSSTAWRKSVAGSTRRSTT